MFFPAYLGWLTRFDITPYSFWDTRTALRVLPLGITYTVMLYSSNWGLSVRLPPFPLPCPVLHVQYLNHLSTWILLSHSKSLPPL